MDNIHEKETQLIACIHKQLTKRKRDDYTFSYETKTENDFRFTLMSLTKLYGGSGGFKIAIDFYLAGTTTIRVYNIRYGFGGYACPSNVIDVMKEMTDIINLFFKNKVSS